MRKWIILGVILLVLVGAAAIAVMNLNSYLNSNKEWVRGEVEKALGRTVGFDEVGVSLFPSIGASVKNLSIADDPRFGKEEFVRAGDAQVAVKLLPLLFRSVEVSKVVLEAPAVNVIRDETGFNFDSIGKTTTAEPTAEPTPTAPKETKDGEPTGQEKAAFLVSLMRIRDGEIRYLDKRKESAADLRIRDLDFEASDLSLTSPITLEIAAALFDSEKQNFTLAGTLGPLGEPADVQKAPLDAKLALDPLDIEKLRKALPAAAKQIPPGLGLSGPVKLEAGLSGSLSKLDVKDLDLAAAVFGAPKPNLMVKGAVGPVGAGIPTTDIIVDAEVTLGPVVIDNVKKLEQLKNAFPAELSSADPVNLSVKAKGKPDTLALVLGFDGDDAEIRYAKSFVKPKGVPFQVAVEAVRKGNGADVSKLSVKLAALEVGGKGSVAAGEKTVVDFKIDSNATSLSGWDRMLPALTGHEVSGTVEVHLAAKGAVGGGALPQLNGTVALANVNAKQAGSPYEVSGLTATARFDGDTMTLPPSKFSLGGSPIQIEAKVASFQKPIVDYRLQSAGVRLASLGVAGAGVAKEEVVKDLDAQGRLEMTGANPLFRGTVRSSAGTLRDVEFQALDVDFGLRDQIATLDKLALRAYQGSYSGSGRYDMRDATNPKFAFNSDVRDMDLAGLLGAQMPAAADRISGKLFADLDLNGSGSGWETIQQTLRGQGRVDVQDGVLKDVNLAESVLSGVTGVPGLSNFISPRIRKKYPDIFATGDTKFEKLGGSVQIADGRANTRDLEITARDYSMRGEGVYELRNHLDFKATLFASKALSTDIIDDVKEAKYLAAADGRIEIPFRVTGALPSVKPMPDAAIIQKAIGRAVIDKGLEKIFGKPKKEEPTAPLGPGETAPEPKPTKKLKPEQELLKKGLEGLFGR
jgi:hypothetical protein